MAHKKSWGILTCRIWEIATFQCSHSSHTYLHTCNFCHPFCGSWSTVQSKGKVLLTMYTKLGNVIKYLIPAFGVETTIFQLFLLYSWGQFGLTWGWIHCSFPYCSYCKSLGVTLYSLGMARFLRALNTACWHFEGSWNGMYHSVIVNKLHHKKSGR